MIDLHSHILPGLDDGAQSLEEALAMARLAVTNGITDIVATPHTGNGRYENEREGVLAAVAHFQRELAAAEIPLRIHPGAEVHLHPDAVEQVLTGQALTVGDGGRYVLLELPARSIPFCTDEVIRELTVAGVTPIIAHPERNAVLREDSRRLAGWIERGVIAQVTAAGLLGRLGKRSLAAAERMVRERLVHVAASDAHNTGRRCPDLQAALRRVAALGGEEEAVRYLENARSVLHGGICRVEAPGSVKAGRKKRFFLF